jgi:hypothetical protein
MSVQVLDELDRSRSARRHRPHRCVSRRHVGGADRGDEVDELLVGLFSCAVVLSVACGALGGGADLGRRCGWGECATQAHPVQVRWRLTGPA